ncbi:MAG: hypothetical protein WBE72_03095 [Terracidiphilus sp.]
MPLSKKNPEKPAISLQLTAFSFFGAGAASYLWTDVKLSFVPIASSASVKLKAES